jgi:CelD/BcsL family acetyltransferase involved in cellulose biosynthesis
MSNKTHHKLDCRFSIQVLEHVDSLPNFKEDWNNLAAAQGVYMPFLSFEWFWLWLQHFLDNNQLYVLLLYDGPNLACLAPFIRKREKVENITVYKIELIGNVYSPFRNFLFTHTTQKQRQLYLSLILDFLAKQRSNWDLIDFYGIPEESGHFDVLRHATTKTQFSYDEYTSFGDWYLDNIDFPARDYIAMLPKKLRKDVRYCKRRLEKMGNLEFKLITNADVVDKYMDLYYQVYSKSWQEKEGVGPTFHRDFAKLAATSGWLRLGFLCLDKMPISTQFWIACNNASFILKTVYDQNYRKYSPGKILTTEMIKYAIDVDGVSLIDYVQGDEPYKKDWLPKRRERKGLLVFNSNIKGNFLSILTKKIRPWLHQNAYFAKAKILKRKLFT